MTTTSKKLKPVSIGEGGYGCVYDPSFKCSNVAEKNINYTNRVSKVLNKYSAQEEFDEFKTVSKIDPNNKIHMGTPILCKPPTTAEFGKIIKKCGPIKSTRLASLSLLIMDNGGPDLNHFFTKDANTYFKSDRQNKVDNFLIQLHTLFIGLKIFKDNDIIHHDIKPHNILFNQQTGKINYIDFGLMTTKQKMVDAIKNDACGFCIFHWSYPLSLGLLNYTDSMNFAKLTNKEKDKVVTDFTKHVTNKNNSSMNETYGSYNMIVRQPTSYQITFSYLNKKLEVPTNAIIEEYISSFVDSFTTMRQMYTRDIFNDRIINSIDIYGVGITIAFIAGSLFKGGFITTIEYKKLFGFSEQMWDFNMIYQLLDVNKLITKFEKLMDAMGILDRLNMKFVDNNIVQKHQTQSPPKSTKPPDTIPKPVQSPKTAQPSAKIQASAYKDPLPIINDKSILRNPSPDKKETTLYTSCINKCKLKYIPNKRSSKSHNKTEKQCSEKKERNPKTRRCINKCKPNYSRSNDGKFKCIRNKRSPNPKSRNNTEKQCPDTKERNPRTRRCINKCKPNYSRSNDGKFKCISNKN